MSKMTTLLCIAALLLALPLLSGCMDQDGNIRTNQAVAAEDPHAGHDHGDEPATEDDPHAGHDHGDEPATEDDPHAGHDHGNEPAVEDDPHAGHDHGAEDEAAGISLSADQIRELKISSAPAGPGTMGRNLELTGELVINEDAVTHVSPRIGGTITRVYAKLGDSVRRGSPLVELDSIELAEVKSEYLATLSRLDLAADTLDREKHLVEKGISAEQDYQAAKQAYDEEVINRRTVEYKLGALGLSDAQIKDLTENPGALMTSITVYAPAGGEIIEKHAAVGEIAETDSELFVIGNLSSVWAKLNVHQQDFVDVREGMDIVIDAGHGIDPVYGVIDYIEPLIGEQTRTATARVTLANAGEVFRPGLFVNGYLEIGGGEVDLVVPRSAVVDLDQDKLLFLRHGTDFEPVVVTIGRQTATSIEILSGIAAGDEVVVSGAFQLKAELLKGTFDPHAGHAH